MRGGSVISNLTAFVFNDLSYKKELYSTAPYSNLDVWFFLKRNAESLQNAARTSEPDSNELIQGTMGPCLIRYRY